MWLYLICIIYINDLFILKDTDEKHHYYEDTVRFSHLFLLLSFSEWKALCQVLGIELISLKSSQLKIFSPFPITWLTHTYSSNLVEVPISSRRRWAELLGWTNGPFACVPQRPVQTSFTIYYIEITHFPPTRLGAPLGLEAVSYSSLHPFCLEQGLSCISTQ